MSLLRRKGLFESTKVLFLPIAAISPNPDQPRTCFSREGLEELAASIQELGVLQPLSVRRSKNGGYELISGERRLRASRMAGLTEVPCILVSVDSQGSSLLALVENLQRRDLNFVEEATALAKLIETYHLSQEEAARRIGKSQSAVANKLRLLRLPPDVLTLLRERGCTERCSAWRSRSSSAWPPGMWQSRGLLWPGRRSMWKPCFIRQTSPPAKNQPL
mgnify:CR=1 FL=1